MSNTHAISLKRSTALLAAMTFVALLTVVNISAFFGKVSAAQLTSRSLTLSSTLSGTETGDSVAGSPTNGSNAVHTFNFTPVANAASWELEYCTNAIGTCTQPTGLSISSATGTSFTSSSAYEGAVATALTGGTPVSFELSGVTNPTYASPTDPDDNTFFVRITTLDGSSAVVDEGTVASAVTQGIEITARVAETLGFSTTGDETEATNNVATGACEALEGSNAIQLGDPSNEYTLSITQAWDAYSFFRLYSNAANGVVVQYQGDTLTKDTDTIDAIGSTAAFVDFGEEQFGLAVDQGADGGTFAGMDVTWPTDTPGALELEAEYAGGAGSIAAEGAGAEFAFDAASPTTGKTIAASDVAQGGYVDCVSGSIRYVGNISPLTSAGTYTTTIVYSAVPTY